MYYGDLFQQMQLSQSELIGSIPGHYKEHQSVLESKLFGSTGQNSVEHIGSHDQYNPEEVFLG